MKIMIPHVMRKLSFIEKEKFLVDTLSIPESEIKKIRSISDTEKRMVEAARLQWEMFKDIHGDVTAWLSGFYHESRIRAKFGSHFSIREKLGLLRESRYTDIEFSQEDLRRRIEIPEDITPELAEETGVHIGDGSIGDHDRSYRYTITGDLIEEISYHKDFLSILIEELYKIKPKIKVTSDKGSCDTIVISKAIVEFKHKVLGLPLGIKSKLVSVPTKIKESDFSIECLRGIFDTDGYLALDKGTCVLSVFSASEKLLSDIKTILTKYGYKFGEQKTRSEIRLTKSGTIKFLEEVKLHSIKHWSKFLIWKEIGFCPSSTHTEERLAVIRGELPFEGLVKISEERKAPERGIST